MFIVFHVFLLWEPLSLEGTFLNKTPTIQPFPKLRGRFIFETCELEVKKVEALKRSAIVLEMLQNEKNT